MNKYNIGYWGPRTWDFLNVIAFKFPDNSSQEDRENYMNFFDSLANVLPCGTCREHYKEWISDNKAVFNTRQDAINWVVELHNNVNSLTDKRQYTPEELEEEMLKVHVECTQKSTNCCLLLLVILFSIFIVLLIIFILRQKRTTCR